MNTMSERIPFSFSMINLVKLMPEWNWHSFDQVMYQAGTNRVELVPSMLMGIDWDKKIEAVNGPIQQAIKRMMQQYSVASIQSLTYGLNINLADPLIDHPDLLRRLNALKILAGVTDCSVLILGSPGQKKKPSANLSDPVLKQMFIDNCRWMASVLGPNLILSLEHNTIVQGAEYCNNLIDIIDVVRSLRQVGLQNTGINLDTKCLIQEFGADVRFSDILSSYALPDLVRSIQVSFDFLSRDVPHCAEDRQKLRDFALHYDLPLSLEEFGLTKDQVLPFVGTWNCIA